MTCIGILGISVTEKGRGGGGTSCFGEVSNALVINGLSPVTFPFNLAEASS